ncbi:MAG: rhomboid family intramembrane serine protease [Desulfobulbaceae bacterium]|nr:rhomboid family intramembrane serine protease [Desulfobulbaceae bacterium]
MHSSDPVIEVAEPREELLSFGSVSQEQVELYSLVLLSVNISHKVIRREDGWRLSVASADLAEAFHHLAAFEEENRQWPTPSREVLPETSYPQSSWGFIALLLGLMIFYGVTGPWGADNRWFVQGAVISQQVLTAGESWRVVTGLTLHADASHLLGNVALGGLVLSYLASQTGTGAVWFIALVTGAMGNYLNALYHGGGHRSVGFSTAVFGLIGCLCGLRMLGARSPRSLMLPLGAGAGLLAMLGMEGERTDVGAHLWGFAVGVVLGVLWHWPISRRLFQSGWSQFALGCVSFLTVLVAWGLALGR